MPKNETRKFVLGAGEVYFDPFDEDGNRTGERYLGDTPGFSLNVSATNQELWTSDDPIAERAEYVATQVTREASIECRNISLENLALFLIGDVAEQDQGSDSVTGEDHTVKTDRWYQLGQDDDNPTGVRGVENVTVTDSEDTSYTEGEDYELDADLGRIRPMPDGSIDDDTTLEIDYDTVEATWDRITSNNLGAQDGALRYIAANTAGPNRDLYAPRTRLLPDGDLAWKSRDTWQAMTFNAALLVPDTGAAAYIDGRSV
ncbi:MAG: hypothetical protein ACLFRB_06790 [Thiohalorhabdus sp.]|uniref:phage tail tube protein n=1 Tax=Thiohalorhabdus sp. TaxID=3094134 RepID=UPI00397FE9DB